MLFVNYIKKKIINTVNIKNQNKNYSNNFILGFYNIKYVDIYKLKNKEIKFIKKFPWP